MGFIAVECPSCGANLTLNDSRDFAFCEYCGKKIVQDKKVIELQGSVEVKGIATEESLLERGYLLLEDKNFNKAYQCFNRVCDINPRCSKAYWGMLLCQLKATKENVTLVSNKTLDSYPNYQKAVRFANNEERKEYTQANKLIAMRIQNEFVQLKKSKVQFIIFTILTVYLGISAIGVFIIFGVSLFTNESEILIPTLITFIIIFIPLCLVARKTVRCRKNIERINGKKI